MTRRLASALLAFWLALVLALGPALAQDPLPAQDYAHWKEVSARADAALTGTPPSDLVLNALRSELVRFRSEFQAAESTNSDRIQTAQEQLNALGPPPAAGQTEAPDIATKRKELTDQIAQLKAPGIAAQQAYEHANGLIREIDKLIRTRQTARLIERGPMPADPANWVTAAAELGGVLTDIGSEVTSAVTNPTTQAQILENLPAILALLLVVLLGFGYAGAAARRAANFVEEKFTPLTRDPALLGASLLRIALPLIGLYALVEALTLSGIPGFRGAYLVEALPAAGAIVIAGIWLGAEAFPPGPPGPAALRIDPDWLPGGRRAAVLIALSFAALVMIERLDRFGDFSAATPPVLAFPPLVLAAYGLWELARRIRVEVAALKEAATEDEPANRVGVAFRSVLWRLVAIAAWLGPLLGAIGYRQAALALVFPMAMTLALIVIVRLVQELASDLYVLLTGSGHEARDGLVPVLLNLVLATAALPLLAVIWGARWADLGEIWSQVSGGFTIGTSRISIGEVLSLVLIFTVGYIATRSLQATLRISVLPKTKITPGGRTALISGVGYVGIFIAGLVAINSTGINLSSLAFVAGALSVGIGFGLQNIVSNFVSGVILLIERPVSEGDWIEVGGNTGIVKAISVRSTRIETFDRTDVIVPNQDLISGTVTNWTHGNTIGRLTLSVGVAYGTDTRRVEKILSEVAIGHEVVLRNPKPMVTFDGFGASSLDFLVRVYLRDVNKILIVKTELNHQIAERFKAEGIEIPFAQQDIWLRNPETLRAPSEKPEPQPPAKPEEAT